MTSGIHIDSGRFVRLAVSVPMIVVTMTVIVCRVTEFASYSPKNVRKNARNT